MSEEMNLELERKFASEFTEFAPPLPVLDHVPDEELSPLARQIDWHLSRQLQEGKLHLPKLDQFGNLMAFSDYAGNHKTFQSYAFLFSGYKVVEFFKERMIEFRNENELGKSEFQFKERGNRAAKLAEEFAGEAARLPGLCVVLLVHKDVPSLFAPQPADLVDQLKNNNLPSLGASIVERLCRIVIPLSYFSILLQGESPKLFWQSDRDELFDTDERTTVLDRVWEDRLVAFNDDGRVPFDQYGRTEIFSKETDEEVAFRDLMSIADIAAGVSADALEGAEETADSHSLRANLDRSKKPHTHFIDVFCGQNTGLRHLTFTVRPSKDAPAPRVYLTEFDRNDINPRTIPLDPNDGFAND